MTRITDDDKNQRLFNRCENSLLFSIKQIFLLYLWREGELRERERECVGGWESFCLFNISLQLSLAADTRYFKSRAHFSYPTLIQHEFLTRKLSRYCSTLMGIWILFFLLLFFF